MDTVDRVPPRSNSCILRQHGFASGAGQLSQSSSPLSSNLPPRSIIPKHVKLSGTRPVVFLSRAVVMWSGFSNCGRYDSPQVSAWSFPTGRTSPCKSLCFDSGHFHPTESIADKLSAVFCMLDGIPLHVSRDVHRDSDHVTVLNDELLSIAREAAVYGCSAEHPPANPDNSRGSASSFWLPALSPAFLPHRFWRGRDNRAGGSTLPTAM